MQRFLLYFFATVNDEFVKIGNATSNLYRRIEQVQIGCPIPIRLLGIIQCKDKSEMLRREKEIHGQFKDYNTIGEWFRIVPEISAYVDEFAESGEDILELDCNSYREKVRQRNANREYNREYRREYNREYHQRPEVKERRLEEKRKYNQKPEVKEKERKRKQTVEYKEQQRQYRQRPEVRERNREYQREYRKKNR